eukprot:11157218-Lingulodinium_polyedra.AAC.1
MGEQLGVKVDIFILLHAEVSPCSWKPTLQFWGSKVLSDPRVDSMVHTATYLHPPVRTFLKA